MTKLVVFDLDDTLYKEETYVMSGFRAVADFLEEKTGIKSEKFFLELSESFKEDGRGKNFDRIIKKFGIKNVGREAMVDVYRRHIPNIAMDKITIDVLNYLKNKYTLALLTNGWLEVQKNKVKALSLDNYFDSFFYAQENGLEYRKPNEKYFLKILEHYNLDAKGVLMVGDDYTSDIESAAKLGFSVFHLKTISDIGILKQIL